MAHRLVSVGSMNSVCDPKLPDAGAVWVGLFQVLDDAGAELDTPKAKYFAADDNPSSCRLQEPV
jgi:hypothetical protein